jgi:hypothetical protein
MLGKSLNDDHDDVGEIPSERNCNGCVVTNDKDRPIILLPFLFFLSPSVPLVLIDVLVVALGVRIAADSANRLVSNCSNGDKCSPNSPCMPYARGNFRNNRAA